MTLTVIVVYLLLVLAIGGLSQRLLRRTGEDYFLATRSIGSFILLMSLFGTHMTAFALLGASGEAYHRGIGVFALMASSSALVVPVLFLLLGPRLWELGKRYGYLTQVQFFRDRWGSDGLGLLLFGVLTALLVPYLVIGVKGGGVTLAEITDGRFPEAVGSIAMCAVVLTYVTAGGLRGTAWANTFQTLVFMTLGAATFFLITDRLGGLSAALDRVAEVDPNLLVRGERIGKLELLSYTVIPMSVGMFPHIFMHWLTARDARAFRLPIVAYPICIAIVWIPSVLLGVLGAAEAPGLQGPAANSILVKMISLHAPEVLAGLLAAGVFAAVMSSLDSQALAASTMFTQDVVRHYGLHDEMSDRLQVLLGRLFVVGILAVSLVVALTADRSIFRMGVWSFSGFAALTPVVFAALYWRRSTAGGAFAAVSVTAVLWIWYVARSWSDPGYTVFGSGLKPAAVMLLASAAAMVVGSLATPAPDPRRVARFFDDGR
ncbi:MAG: sodium:solute symporter family protein [Thermoanaerobaculia bacterium]|nr:sodium:solute symporter family protein [Thermoanaerobaculia bacterium]